MVQVVGREEALKRLTGAFKRTVVIGMVALVGVIILYGSCVARVLPNEFGVEQSSFGIKTGILDRIYEPGLYVIGVGSHMYTFPREIHVLEASNDREESRAKASSSDVGARVDEYFNRRDQLLGAATHRTIDGLNVQTSDGYSVLADVTLLYTIVDPIKVARDFGWGSLYVDSFVVSTFRNGVAATLGKINAESFYDETVRIQAVKEVEKFLQDRFQERGFRVEKLLLRNYSYAATYEKSLHDKKVAVQLTVKNRKEGLVNEEKAKLQQIDSQGNAAITIAESEVNAQISRIKAEAGLYSSQIRAKADRDVNVAAAEAKRLKADALTRAGGKYVVALETAKMFDNMQTAVMTPEQYIQFIRAAWSIIGVSGNGGGK
jgi:regulator of protease activity HflC (stomatin/prohibitin superfamily)